MATRFPPLRALSAVDADQPGPISDQGLTDDVLAAISAGVVRLFCEHTGGGPTRARTTVSAGLVMVIIADSLTLVDEHAAGVDKNELMMRRRDALHGAMRAEAISVVEELTHREVIAYLPDQQLDPELATIFFLLAPCELRETWSDPAWPAHAAK